MDDWRQKILTGLRESKLMLACLSPAYMKSDYCKWEYEEYVKHEIGKSFLGEGIAPIYFVEIPRWEDKDFDSQCENWISELRHRHYLDLRPWYHEGEEALHRSYINERFTELNHQITDRIERELKLAKIPGNIIAHNKQFIGRQSELDRLRTAILENSFGTVTIVHGLGGIGKTALVIEYAYVFALNYGGGRWQVRCEGKNNILQAIAELASSLRIRFNETEKTDTFLQFQRVIAELKFLASAQDSQQCLLILDNVDYPELLSPRQLQYLPSEDWLQVIATTRLGENELGIAEGKCKEFAFFPVNEMSAEDAVLLMESFQPGGFFKSDTDREIAWEIANYLGGYTLAVEAVAVFLGYFSHEISFENFLKRFKEDHIRTLDSFSEETNISIRHGEVSLSKTLSSTLEQLSVAEKDLLSYAAFMPADYIPLTWLRQLLAKKHEEFLYDSESGLPDKWLMLVRRLISLRLIEISQKETEKAEILLARMHRLVAPIVLNLLVNDASSRIVMSTELGSMLLEKAASIDSEGIAIKSTIELNALYEISKLWLRENRIFAISIVLKCSNSLRLAGNYNKSIELSELLVDDIKNREIKDPVLLLLALNMQGVASLYLRMNPKAEKCFSEAFTLINDEAKNLRKEDKLDTFTNLGSFYRENYQPDKALPLCKEALSVAEEVYGENSSEAALRNVNLGLVYLGLANIDKSIYYLRKAVKIDKLHPHLPFALCQDLSSLAEVLRNNGMDDEAEMIINEAIDIAEKSGFNQHPVFPFVIMNKARVLEDKKNYEESRELLRTSYDIILSKYGKDSLQESHCLNNLAVNSMGMGHFEDAIEELRTAIMIEQSHSQTNIINLAHRNFYLGIAFLLNKEYHAADEMISLAFDEMFSPALDYFNYPDRNHFLYARILLLKMIVSEIFKKPSLEFEEMLVSLIDQGNIFSIGVDYRWSMEYILKDFVKNNLPEWYVKFETLYNTIANYSS